MKLKNKTPGCKFDSASLVAVGNAGVAFCLSEPPEGFPRDGTPTVAQFRSFKASGFEATEVGELHASGRGCGLPEWDSCLFVSHRGTPVRVLPLSAALKSGVVSSHRVLLRRDGKETEATVYAPAKWSPAQRQPKFLATDALPAGRVESKLVQPDKRNAGYVGHVLPLAMKRADKSPAPKPSVPAKAPPVPAKASKAPAPVKSPALAVKPSPKAPKAPAK